MTEELSAWLYQMKVLELLVQAVPQLVFDHKDLHWAAEVHNTIETTYTYDRRLQSAEK